MYMLDEITREMLLNVLRKAQHSHLTSAGVHCTDITEEAMKIPEDLRWVSGDYEGFDQESQDLEDIIYKLENLDEV